MATKIGNPIDIAVSGLRAQAMQMSVISNNIANSNTAKVEGQREAFRRKFVSLTTDPRGISGVQIGGISADEKSPLKQIYDPGRPGADAEGYVTMPNVDIPLEMMNLVTASRAYEASASVLKRYQDNIEATLELLR